MRPYSVLVVEPGETLRRVSWHFSSRNQAAKFAKRIVSKGTDPETIFLGIDRDGTLNLEAFQDSELH